MLIRLIKQDEISFQLRLRLQKKEILFAESRTLKSEFCLIYMHKNTRLENTMQKQ